MNSRSATGVVFSTSALILVIELVAGRLMAPYVGVSLEAFTGIIGTVLAGIATGSAVGGYLADNHDPRGLIGLALLGGGGFTWLSIPIVATLGPGSNGTAPEIIILTGCAFFMPTALLSSITPMVTKLRLDTLDETGSVVGNLSAAGTFGALLGTFSTGFILLGLLPIRAIIIATGALLVAAGVVALWRFGTRRPSGFESGMVVVAALLTLGVGTDCDYETDYACAKIIPDDDRPGGRSLILDQVRHAHVDLDDPTHLELRYTQLFGTVIEAMDPGPIDVVHVGGGGFSMARYLTATRPGSTNTVLEIDAGLVEVAEQELGLADAGAVDIRIGDARLELPQLESEGFDLVIGDAFGGDVVPWHLTTAEAVAEYDRMLRGGGIYVLNVIDGGESRFARAQIKTLTERFEHVGVFLPEAAEGDDRLIAGSRNQVIVASRSPLPAFELASDAGASFVTGEGLVGYIGDSIVLTDNFAPAEQLKQ